MAALSVAGIAQSGNSAAVAQIKTVYLLPMSRGMDQYLANRLTRGGVVQVVTDPKKADALLTDHLGAAFEASVKELYPEVKPAAPAKAEDKHEDKAVPAKTGDKPDEKAAPAKAEDKQDEKTPPADAKPDDDQMKSIAMDHPPTPSRGRGMVFLVKRGTSEVLWSAYYDPSIRKPKELNQMAGRLSDWLKKAMTSASPTAPGDK